MSALEDITNPILRRYVIAQRKATQKKSVTRKDDTLEDLRAVQKHEDDVALWLGQANVCLRSGTHWTTCRKGEEKWCFCGACLAATEKEEFTGVCTRLTLLRDRYWDTHERTRSFAYTYTFFLWLAQLKFRVLRIMLLKQAAPGGQKTGSFFLGQGFPVPEKQREETISKWTPETIQDALQMLVWAHSEGCVRLGPALWAYWEAVQDRMAVLSSGPFVHHDF